MRILVTIVFICCVHLIISQNLIQNPSFEIITPPLNCAVTNLSQVNNWHSINTPDLFSTLCGNFQYQTSLPISLVGTTYPKSGRNVAGAFLIGHANGIISGGGEMIYQKLSLPLIKNHIYCMSYYVTLADNTEWATSDIDAWFTDTMPTFMTPFIHPTPQIKNQNGIITDTSNWVLVTDTFIAKGTEQYVVIGNFTEDSKISYTQVEAADTSNTSINSTGYYFFDDISLVEFYPIQLINDTSICLNDSVLIGNNQSYNGTYSWQPNIGLSCNNCPNPKASPQITTTYVLTKQDCNIMSRDSITVTVINECDSVFIIPNVFTPNGDGTNDVFSFTLKNGTVKTFAVYNRWGNIVHLTSNISNLSFIQWDGHTTAGEPCNDGVYFYVLEYIDAKGELKTKRGYVSLMR